jgi:uncharacterized protein with HEPN domain
MRSAKRDPRVFLDDILAAIARIEAYTVEGKAVFLRDGKTQDAVIRQLSVIGEAAAKLPTAVRAMQPDIPWKAVVGMRNILIHDYSAVSIRSVWATVIRDLPALRHAVEAILTPSSKRVPKGTGRKQAA